ncbi:hypothetical protein GOQ29_01815 [Clostridium sp. D2Q-14]|uniref:hypothetical protein n=1 Tax=Anaeromonas gelatinilytica TaxID=2683194 RepID=UPI00193B3D97|nr:hypothetical protein [Anaeromonas gelatinilytica]MBS4534350.1 hypothetical protein [Anaeromonas gelatinilytica]
MKNLVLDSLYSIIDKSSFSNKYYYIAHLLDRVLLGQSNDDKYNILIQAIKDERVLELHLFNEEKEIFVSRVDGQYIQYKPLLHQEQSKEKPVITRYYKLIHNSKIRYTALKVKEYISYDEDSHMAYVDKTVLHSLIEEGKNE